MSKKKVESIVSKKRVSSKKRKVTKRYKEGYFDPREDVVSITVTKSHSVGLLPPIKGKSGTRCRFGNGNF